MKNDLIINVSGANNKTLNKMKIWVQNNPIHKTKKRIVLKNNDVIIATNY